jgi:hypothetical protein
VHREGAGERRLGGSAEECASGGRGGDQGRGAGDKEVLGGGAMAAPHSGARSQGRRARADELRTLVSISGRKLRPAGHGRARRQAVAAAGRAGQ